MSDSEKEAGELPVTDTTTDTPISSIPRTVESTSFLTPARTSVVAGSSSQTHLSHLHNITPSATPTRTLHGGNSRQNIFAFISHSPDTYRESRPAIDNEQLARRKRRRTSPTELSILEQEFEISAKPDKKRRESIAFTVGMSEKAVQIWFQNRRAHERHRRRRTSEQQQQQQQQRARAVGSSSSERVFLMPALNPPVREFQSAPLNTPTRVPTRSNIPQPPPVTPIGMGGLMTPQTSNRFQRSAMETPSVLTAASDYPIYPSPQRSSMKLDPLRVAVSPFTLNSIDLNDTKLAPIRNT